MNTNLDDYTAEVSGKDVEEAVHRQLDESLISDITTGFTLKQIAHFTHRTFVEAASITVMEPFDAGALECTYQIEDHAGTVYTEIDPVLLMTPDITVRYELNVAIPEDGRLYIRASSSRASGYIICKVITG